MKAKILKIADDLKENLISTADAKELLLEVLGVRESACNNFFSDPFSESNKCLNCGKKSWEHKR